MAGRSINPDVGHVKVASRIESKSMHFPSPAISMQSIDPYMSYLLWTKAVEGLPSFRHPSLKGEATNPSPSAIVRDTFLLCSSR